MIFLIIITQVINSHGRLCDNNSEATEKFSQFFSISYNIESLIDIPVLNINLHNASIQDIEFSENKFCAVLGNLSVGSEPIRQLYYHQGLVDSCNYPSFLKE